MAKTAALRLDDSNPADVRLVAIPIRVSTTMQAANDEGSMKTQLQRVRAYIEMKRQLGEDWREVAVYELPAVSGKHSLQSPGLQRLWSDIETKKVNTVLVTELSRLSRNVTEFLQFVEFINEQGAEFVSLKQKYDTTSSQGRLFLNIMSVLAQFEREMTAERTKDSTAARSERGLWNGGRICGYDLDAEHKGYLISNEREAEIVRVAFETYLACGSIARTVEALNAAGHRTKAYTSRNKIEHRAEPFQFNGVQHMLKNWAYVGIKEIGKMRRGKPGTVPYRQVPAVWPAIVDRKMFDDVQALMARNGQTRTNQAKDVRHAYVLNSGLLLCGACGSAMEGRSGTGRNDVQYFYYACRDKKCSIRVVASEIENAVLERLGVLARRPDIVDQLVAATNTQLQRQLPVLGKRRRALLREAADTKGQADRLLTRIADFEESDGMAMVSEKLAELAERRRQLESAVRDVDEAISRVQAGRIGSESVLQALAHITELYQCLKPYEQKELVRLILQKAEVHPREIKLAIYTEALSTMAEGPQLATIGTKRSESPNRLPDEDSNLEPSG